MRLLRGERAQTTVEYIMLLATVVGFALIVFKTLKPVFARLNARIGNFGGFFQGDLHRLPFK